MILDDRQILILEGQKMNSDVSDAEEPKLKPVLAKIVQSFTKSRFILKKRSSGTKKKIIKDNTEKSALWG